MSGPLSKAAGRRVESLGPLTGWALELEGKQAEVRATRAALHCTLSPKDVFVRLRCE